jgi:hypothetical protein
MTTQLHRKMVLGVCVAHGHFFFILIPSGLISCVHCAGLIHVMTIWAHLIYVAILLNAHGLLFHDSIGSGQIMSIIIFKMLFGAMPSK